MPRGHAVILADGNAYFFAAATKSGRSGVLLEKLDAAQDANARYLAGEIKPSEFIGTMEALAAVSLALQYSDETVSRVIEDGLITGAEYEAILSSTFGTGPGYQVSVKKK